MQIKVNKRSTYAPICYEATRPYAVALGNTYLRESRKGAEARLRFVQGTLLRQLKIAAARIGRENGPGPLILRALPPGLCDFSKAGPACSALVR